MYTTNDSNIFTLEENALPAAPGYRAKVIRSGPLMEIEICPVWNTKPAGIRAQKVKPSRKAQRNQNEKDSRKLFSRLLHCNFGIHDYHLVCSYQLAPSEEQARKDARNFLRRYQTARKKAGLPPGKYMYVIEYSDNPLKRIHHHFILEGGLGRDVMEGLWRNGRSNCRRLQPDGVGLEGLARYLMKDPRGAKRWGASRGLKRPKITYRKITRRRAEAIASRENEAPELFEKIYKDYTYIDMLPPRYSEYVSGVYIYARMMRKGVVW